MEFRNLTPFSVLNYKMLDTNDQEYHVVAMKVAYQLELVSEGIYRAVVVDESPVDLCVQDQFAGEMNQSSVQQESDLAPFKPRCDVIVNGTAIAPEGEPCLSFPVGIKLTDVQDNVLLEKYLNVTGERYFNKPFLDWTLTEPEPFTELKLDYQFAFGGECCVDADDKNAKKIPEHCRLTESQRAAHPNQENTPIAHTVCESNPLGMGFIEPWYNKASPHSRYPAPRIETLDHPITADFFDQLVKGQVDPLDARLQPAGLGIIGRAWQPRLKKAGTYDDEWLADRHPYLPADFDFGYWNGAPDNQQMVYPPNDLKLSLYNLTEDGELHCQLPGHRPFILLWEEDGNPRLLPMQLDTLLIDSDQLTLMLTYRCRYLAKVDIQAMQVRFETDPRAKLLKVILTTQQEGTQDGR